MRPPAYSDLLKAKRRIERGISNPTVTARLREPNAASINRVARSINSQLRGSVTIGVSVPRSNTLTSFNRGLTYTQRQIKQTKDEIEDFGKKSSLAFKRFAAFSISAGAIIGIGVALRNSIKEAIDFQNILVRISQVSGGTIDSVSGISDEVRRLATTFGVSSRELLDASQVLVQAGFSARDTQKALETLAKTDLAPTFDSIADTTEGIIASMNQFGFSIDELQGKFGAINAVAGAFAVESGDLVTAFRKSGSSFRAAGGDLEELLALFTSVRATTRQSADTIANGFNTIFARLQRVSTSDFLSQFGIQIRDAEGQFVGARQAIEQIGNALRNIPTTDHRFAKIVEEIGGFRQLKVVIPLLKQYQVARNALNVAQKGSISLDRDAETSQQSLSRQITKVKEEFDKLISSLTNSTTFRTLIDLTIELTRSLTRLVSVAEKVLPLVATLGIHPLLRTGARFAGGFRGNLFASGGLVGGIGNKDTVPALLTPGEFVLNKRAVQKVGVEQLEKLNAKKFNKGGLVGYQTGGLVKGLTGNVVSGAAGLLIIDSAIRSLGGFGQEISKITSSLTSVGVQFIVFNQLLKSSINSEKLRNKVTNEFVRARQEIRSRVVPKGFIGPPTVNQISRQDAITKLDVIRVRRNLGLKDVDNLEKRAAFVGVGAAIAIELGEGLKSFFSKPDNIRPIGAALSGGLSGVGTGGIIGGGLGNFLGSTFGGAAGAAKFGPIGSGIGAVVGALTGLVTSFNEASESLRRANFQESSDKFSKLLSRIEKDQISASTALNSVINNIVSVNSRLASATGGERTDINAFINSTIPQLDSFATKVAESSTNFEDFRIKTKDVISILSRFTDVPISELNDRFSAQIEAQNKQKELTSKVNSELDKFNQRLIDANNIVAAFSDANDSAEKLSSRLNSLAEAASGNIGAFQSQDLSKAFERALSGRTLNTDTLHTTIDNITRTLEESLGTDRARSLRGNATEALDVINKLPDILLKIAQQDPLGLDEGTDAVSRFETELKKATSNQEIINNLVTSASKLGGEGAEGLSQKIIGDLSDAVSKISSGLEPIIQPFSNSIDEIQKGLSRFSQQLEIRRRLEKGVIDLQNESIDIQKKSINSINEFFGRIPNLQQQQELETNKLRNIAPSTVDRFGTKVPVSVIASNLAKARERLRTIDEQISGSEGNTELQTKLREQRSELVTTINGLVDSLKFLSNSSSKFASNIEEEISRLRQQRETRLGFAKNFLFGSNENRRETLRTSIFAGIAARAGNINAIPESQRENVGQFLEQFADTPLALFGGRTGKDIQKLLLSNAGLGGANKPGTTESGLIAAFETISKGMKEANDALVDDLRSNVRDFSSELTKQHNTFLSDFKRLLVEGNIRNVTSELTRAETNQSTIQQRQKLIGQLGSLTGREINQSTIKDLFGSIQDLSDFKKLQNQKQSTVNFIDFVKQNSLKVKNPRPFFNDTGLFGGLKPITDVEANYLFSKLIEPIVQNTGIRKSTLTEQFGQNFASRGIKNTFVASEEATKILNKELSKNLEERNKSIERLSLSLSILGGDFEKLAAASGDINKILSKLGQDIDVEGLNSQLDQTNIKIKSLRDELENLNKALPQQPQKNPRKKAFGGFIPGSGTRDTVPAMLTPGEFVIRKEAVNSIGLNNLFALNSQGFQLGGPVLRRKKKETDERFLERQKNVALFNAGVGPKTKLGEFFKSKLTQDELFTLNEDKKNALFSQFLQERKDNFIKAKAARKERAKKNRELATKQRPQKSGSIGISGALDGTRTKTGEFVLTKFDRDMLANADDRLKTEFFAAFNNANAAIRTKDISKSGNEGFLAEQVGALQVIRRKLFENSVNKTRTQSRSTPSPIITRKRGERVISNATVTKLGISPTAGQLGRNIGQVKPFFLDQRAKTINQSFIRFGPGSRNALANKQEELRAATKRARTGTQLPSEGGFFRSTVSPDIIFKRIKTDVARETQNSIKQLDKDTKILKFRDEVLRIRAQSGNKEAIDELEKRNARLRRGFNKGGRVGFQTGGPVGTGTGLHISNESIDRFNNVVKSFSDVSKDLINSLSTLTLKFDHTVTHTGQLNIIGALEASQAISDAIIKRVVPLIDQRITQIEHDGSGRHKVRGR